MPARDDNLVTSLLGRAADGESDAAGQLLPLVYEQLRSLAAGYFLDERRHHTLQPTALVHEAYVRLVNTKDIRWESRNQFFVVAAKAMRNVLVDHARARGRHKRGGDWQRVSVDVAHHDDASTEMIDLEALDDALTRLGDMDARKARLVELRFFGGLTSDDAARVLGMARSTAAEHWRLARAWLYRELGGDDDR